MMRKFLQSLLVFFMTAVSIGAFAESDTVFYYTFDGNLNDVSGNAKAMSNPHTATDFYSLDSAGVNGNALYFSGATGTFLEIDTFNLFNPGLSAFTFSVWVKNLSDSAHEVEHVILHQTHTKSYPGTAFGTGATRFFLAAMGEGTTEKPSEVLKSGAFIAGKNSKSNTEIKRGEWTHIAVVGDPVAKTVKYYVNGMPDAVFTNYAIEASTHGFKIGVHRNKPGATWVGLIDDLLLVKRAMTTKEILAMAGAETPMNYMQITGVKTTSATAGMREVDLINLSGIDTLGNDSIVHDWDYGAMFASAANVRAMKMFFNWEQTKTLTGLVLFNHSHFWPQGNNNLGSYFTNRGMKDFKLYYSNAANTRMDTIPLDSSLWIHVNDFQLSRAKDQKYNVGDTFKLDFLEAKWIAIDGLNAWGGNKIGLNEVILTAAEKTPLMTLSANVMLTKTTTNKDSMVQASVSVKPVMSTEKLVWSLQNATAGTTIDANGLIKAGEPGVVTVVATGKFTTATANLTIIPAPVKAIDASKILLYMPFDTAYNDLSGNDHQFTLMQGDTVFSAGKFGMAAEFDSTMLVSKEDSIFSGANGFTLTAWVYHEKTAIQKGTQHTWLHQRDVPSQSGGRIHLEVLAGTGETMDAFGTFSSGIRNDAKKPIDSLVWYHVASVIDTAAKMHYLYINGELASSAVMSKTETNWGQLVLGARKQLTGPYAWGKMDELMITKEALTKDQVMAVMNVGVQKASQGYTPVTSISVAVDNTVESKASVTAVATVSANGADFNGVYWMLNNDSTGSVVDQSGKITAGNKEGVITVVAKAGDGSGVMGSAQVKVKMAEIVLLDFMDNQITYSSQDSAKSHGDLWLRDNPGDAGALKIIPVAEAPAGYGLTDSVLQVVIGANPLAWWQHGLMAETDTLTVDTVNFRYMHVAVFVPGAITMQGSGGIHKSWLKDDKGSQKWNSNALAGGGIIPVAGKWVDHVIDITNDTIHGKKLAHFEWFGFTTNDTSYIGSVVLSGSAEPRFVNITLANEIKLTSAIVGDSVRETQTIKINAQVLPAATNNKVVSWEVVGATEGTSIDANGLLTAGAPGTVTVKATATDGSGVSGTISIKIFAKNTAIGTAKNLEVMVYPNPSNGRFNVMMPNLNEGSFKVFDATGRAVRSGLLNSENVIDLSGNKAGIYLLQLKVGDKTTVTRLMVK
jgi:hypothetical protein